VRAGLYARVHPRHDSLCNLLRCAIYVVKRGWKTALEIRDVGSGASPKGEELLKAARDGGS
jgi:hypothetical protein